MNHTSIYEHSAVYVAEVLFMKTSIVLRSVRGSQTANSLKKNLCFVKEMKLKPHLSLETNVLLEARKATELPVCSF